VGLEGSYHLGGLVGGSVLILLRDAVRGSIIPVPARHVYQIVSQGLVGQGVRSYAGRASGLNFFWYAMVRDQDVRLGG
jgi:hypothetical protein